MDLGISQRTAAVAAASAGLGFASAKALADEGVRVVICSRDADRVAQAAQKIGNGCVGVVADVSTTQGALDFVHQAQEILGHIDIVVANGGGPPAGNFASTDLDVYPAALERSMLATVAMCKEVIPAMQQRGWGRVVAITSTAVRQPFANLILSSTARAGLTAFLKTVATEVAGNGVTVNTVQPGTHATDRIKQLYGSMEGAAEGIPAGVVGDPSDFGSVVAFLCSEQAKFVTGAHLQVDGGSYPGVDLMLQHVVALTWNESVPENYAEVVNKALLDMAKTIPSVRSYRCGADLGVSSHANADYLIVAEFDDVAGWREYDENPLHNEVRAKYFAPYVASRAAAQITF